MTTTFTCSIEVPAPPATVFNYFIDPELLLTWIGDHAVLDAQPGGEFTLDIEGVPVRGRYLEVVAPERVVVSWGHAGSEKLPPGSTQVQFTLTPTDTGATLVEVEHPEIDVPMFLWRLPAHFRPGGMPAVRRQRDTGHGGNRKIVFSLDFVRPDRC